jgi:hypothetical protein
MPDKRRDIGRFYKAKPPAPFGIAQGMILLFYRSGGGYIASEISAFVSLASIILRGMGYMRVRQRTIPEFKSEAEGFEFWSPTGKGGNSSEYVDWAKAKRSKFPNLMPTLWTISVRLLLP